MKEQGAADSRVRLYDEDTRDTLRFGAPLTAVLLLAEGLAHALESGFSSFTLATICCALVVAPLGWIARRPPAWAPPMRFWSLLLWLACVLPLLLHFALFSAASSTFLMIGLIFGCASLIISPTAFGISAGSLTLLLLWWLSRDMDVGYDTRVFATLCVPLAGFVYWARRRALLLGEQQRVLERKLARQRDEMQLVRRVLGINRGLTHHFNNVFSGIVGGTSLALEHLDPAHPAHEAISVALASGEHGSEIIERLGLSGDRGQESTTTFSVQALLEEPAIAALVPATCEWEIVAARDLPEIEGNRGRLQRALSEIIANAVEAIGDEPGAIRAEIDIGDEPSQIAITVIDSGAGMSEGELVRSVEPFYTTREPTRRGLGLPFVMGVIERHGGTIRIDSQPGRGTRVRLNLPAAGR